MKERIIKGIFCEMLIYFPIFWSLCLGLSIGLFIDCIKGQEWLAHYIMGAFCIHYGPCGSALYSINRPFKWQKRQVVGNFRVIKKIIRSEIFVWGFQVTISVLSHMDIYTDLCFIMIAWDSGTQGLWIPSLILFIITTLPKFLAYIFTLHKLYVVICDYENTFEDVPRELLPLASIFELKGAVHNINSVEFSTNLDSFFKLTTNLWKFITEDAAQFILQLIYVLGVDSYCPGDTQNIIVYISLSLSVILGINSIVGPLIARFRTKSIITHGFQFPVTKIQINNRGLGDRGACHDWRIHEG